MKLSAMPKTKTPAAPAAVFFTALLMSWGILSLHCFSQTEKGLSQEEKVTRSKEYYQEGKKFLADGNYSEADKAFKKAQGLLSSLAPDKPFTASGERTEGPAPTQAAAQPKPSLGEKACAASLSGSSQEALTLYLEAIQLSPENANLYYNAAIEYLKTNQFKKAAQFFQKVIQLNPQDTNAYYNLGVLYESYLQDKRQALHYYSHYLKAASPGDTQEVKTWISQIKKELRAK